MVQIAIFQSYRGMNLEQSEGKINEFLEIISKEKIINIAQTSEHDSTIISIIYEK